MPKIVEYPRRSLSDALELAEAVSNLGGTCSIETCAESMKKKVSGAFTALISAAVKYGLVTSKSGELSVTEQFDRYRLAYDEDEKQALLKQAFLNVPLFNQVFARFRKGKLPSDILTKVLIREFDVNENMASAIRQYFIEGATEIGLLTESGEFIGNDAKEESKELEDRTAPGYSEGNQQYYSPNPISPVAADSEYRVTIAGPGMNSTLVIRESEDLLIVNAMLAKVERKLNVASKSESTDDPVSDLGEDETVIDE